MLFYHVINEHAVYAPFLDMYRKHGNDGGYYKSVSLPEKQTFCTGDGDAELKSRDR